MPRVGKLQIAFIASLLVSVILLANNMLSNAPFRDRIYSVTEVIKSIHGLEISSKISEILIMEGALFNRQGMMRELNASVKVSLIHSYSPYTENHFREMMVDPVRREHKIYANSPAILQLDSGEVITVMRVWLEKEWWELTKRQPHNTFSDNYFYIQRFDQHMNAITDGHVLGIPTPIQWTVGDGPIEPRIFSINNTIYITFNTGVFTEGRTALDSTFFWDLTSNKALLPNISGGQPMIDNKPGNSMPRDKHWSALVNGTKLYFTYNLDPLRVIQCSPHRDSMNCAFVHKEGEETYTFKDARDGLRGGTPFVLYRYPYYISIAHGTYFRRCPEKTSRCNGRRYYSTHLILMTIEPDFKILYVSGNIPFPEVSFQVPLVRYRFIENSFFFPVGLILENVDSLVVGGHINDHSSVLYRISNISSAISSAIEASQADINKPGPVPGILQNYTRMMAVKSSGFSLQSGT